MRTRHAQLLVGLIATLALVVAATQLQWVTSTSEIFRGSGAKDPRVEEWLGKMDVFDVEAYARAAIAAQDFRHVIIKHGGTNEHTPGIACLAQQGIPREVVFTHVIRNGEPEVRDLITQAAMRFNRLVVEHPSYPDKDICIATSDRPLDIIEAGSMAIVPSRRPKVIDLHTAVRAQELSEVQGLIAAGANVNGVDRWQHSPLMWAVRRKNAELVRLLISSGADPNPDMFNFGYSSPLIAAVETADLSLVREVLRAGSERTPNADALKGWQGYTNMHVIRAIELGRPDILELLLEFEAVPLRGDGDAWQAPMYISIRSDCTRCFDLMLPFGGKQMAESGLPEQLIAEQLRENNSKFLIPLVRSAIDRISFSTTAKASLLAAANSNKPEIIKLLLNHASNVNLLTAEETRAFLTAASTGIEAGLYKHFSIADARRKQIDDGIRAQDERRIRAAVPRGATLAQTNSLTALMLAAKVATPRIIDILVELGATVNADATVLTDAMGEGPSAMRGETALYYAIEAGNLETTASLLAHGADPEVNISSTPLVAWIPTLLEKFPQETQRKFLELFLTGSHRERRASQMLPTSIFTQRWPESSPDSSIARLLIQAGANSCEPNRMDETAVSKAAAGDDFELFKFVVDHCKKWSPTSPVAREALRSALKQVIDDGYYRREVRTERLKIVKFLLERGVPVPRGPTPIGGDPLCSVVEAGNIDLALALIDAGADPNDMSGGRPALDCVPGGTEAEVEARRKPLRLRGAKTANELGYVEEEEPFPF